MASDRGRGSEELCPHAPLLFHYITDIDLRRSPVSTVEHEKSRLERRLQGIVAKQASNKELVQNLNFFDPSIKVPMNG